jgi:hypothetical protein
MKVLAFTCVAVLLPFCVRSGEGRLLATNAPACIELRDQYDAPQRLSFPATNVTLLTIADRKGSDQVEGWIAALKPRYAGRIDIRGLADCGGAPGFVQGRIRKKFQETRPYPVMMDWSGKASAQFGFKQNSANILVLGRDGRILARFAGAATAPAIAEAIAALDRALSAPSKVAGAANPKSR